MSIEAALEALTKALEANTAAIMGGDTKAPPKPRGGRKPAQTAEDKKAAAEKSEEAEKPKTTRKPRAKKPEIPAPITEIDGPDLRKHAAAYMGSDDEDEREAAKANLSAALKHLGVKKLPELDDDDRPKVATYLAYWAQGLEVDFEELDELVAAASDSGGDDGDDDDEDMLGD